MTGTLRRIPTFRSSGSRAWEWSADADRPISGCGPRKRGGRCWLVCPHLENSCRRHRDLIRNLAAVCLPVSLVSLCLLRVSTTAPTSTRLLLSALASRSGYKGTVHTVHSTHDPGYPDLLVDPHSLDLLRCGRCPGSRPASTAAATRLAETATENLFSWCIQPA